MPFALRPTSNFLAEIAKLDKSIRMLIEKRLERIKQTPRLSKPLEHEPNCYTERVKGYRIVFEVRGEEVILYRVRKRKEAYSN